MASKRTPPRKRMTTGAPMSAQIAPNAPAEPGDGRLTDRALRAHVRKSKPPLFNILSPFRALTDEVDEKMEHLRSSMR